MTGKVRCVPVKFSPNTEVIQSIQSTGLKYLYKNYIGCFHASNEGIWHFPPKRLLPPGTP